VIRTLREFYGLQPTPPADLFQFLIWEVLSEHALPARRDLAWQALRRIPALTPDAMFRAPAKDLLEAIGIAGSGREEKLDRIRAIVGEFKRHRDQLSGNAFYNATALQAARALRRLEHASPPIRARAMLFAGGRTVLPIDDGVHRVVSRLMGDDCNRRRGNVRKWLAGKVSRDTASYREAIVYLRHHAQHTCLKVAPHCGVCPLGPACPSVQRRDAPP
jgi:endonuclease III